MCRDNINFNHNLETKYNHTNTIITLKLILLSTKYKVLHKKEKLMQSSNTIDMFLQISSS